MTLESVDTGQKTKCYMSKLTTLRYKQVSRRRFTQTLQLHVYDERRWYGALICYILIKYSYTDITAIDVSFDLISDNLVAFHYMCTVCKNLTEIIYKIVVE